MGRSASYFSLYFYSALYAFSIVAGIWFAAAELGSGNIISFRNITVLMLAIFLAEIALNIGYHRQVFSNRIPDNLLLSSRIFKLTHHILLPISVFAGVILFIYYNHTTEAIQIILLLSFPILTVMFVNIRSYYFHFTSLESHTNYIYDVIKLFSFFLISNALFHLATTGRPFFLLAVPIVSFGLLAILSSRYEKLDFGSLRLISVLSVALSLASIFVFATLRLGPVQASLLVFVAFYVATAVLYHYVHRDLSWRLLVEYVLVILCASILAYGAVIPASTV